MRLIFNPSIQTPIQHIFTKHLPHAYKNFSNNWKLNIFLCVWVWGVLEQQSFSFDGLKKEKMLVPLTDWLMNNQISQHECWGGNLVARHAPNPWNSASLMWRPV